MTTSRRLVAVVFVLLGALSHGCSGSRSTNSAPDDSSAGQAASVGGDTVGAGGDAAGAAGATADGGAAVAPEQTFVPEHPFAAAPGELALVPPLLVLGVGQTFEFDLQTAPSDLDQESLSWSSLDGQVAAVLDGTVTAYREGRTTVVVSLDGRFAEAELNVTAAPPPARSPASIVFDPFTLSLAPSETASFAYRVFDSDGALDQDPGDLAFSVAGDAFSVMDGAVIADKPGLSWLSATLSGSQLPLVGSMTLVAHAPPPVEQTSCAHEIDGCGVMPVATSLTGPGAFDQLHVAVWRDNCGRPPLVTQESATRVDVAKAGVVHFDNDYMLADAPGSTRVTAYYEGLQCGSWFVGVSPDLSGVWDISCSNGDSGVVYPRPGQTGWQVGPATPRYCSRCNTGGGLNGSSAPVYSCMWNEAEDYSCSSFDPNAILGNVSFNGVGEPVHGDQNGSFAGLCTVENPCSGVQVAVCGEPRHAPVCDGGGGAACNELPITLGPDSFTWHDCTFTRSTSEEGRCGAQPVLPTLLTIDGVSREVEELHCQGEPGNDALVSLAMADGWTVILHWPDGLQRARPGLSLPSSNGFAYTFYEAPGSDASFTWQDFSYSSDCPPNNISNLDAQVTTYIQGDNRSLQGHFRTTVLNHKEFGSDTCYPFDSIEPGTHTITAQFDCSVVGWSLP